MHICAHFQHTSMNHVYLMIGGNIGNRLDNLENARKNSLRLREEFRWNKVLKPVLEYCANPYKVKKNPLALKRHPRKTPTYYYRRIGEIKREEGFAGILRKTAKKLHLPGAKFY